MAIKKPKIKVCRNCKAILNYEVQTCPFCNSRDFSEEYAGFLLVIDPEKSELSKIKNYKEGKWAIKVF